MVFESPGHRDIGIRLVEKPDLAAPRQRMKIGVYAVLPNTGLDHDHNVSDGLANSKPLAKPFAADMSSG